MAPWLVDPMTWMVVAVIVVLGIVFGRLRREPAWAIAANTVGAATLVIGIRRATELSNEAFYAAALATGGFAIWAEATHRTGPPRVARDLKAQT